MAVLPNLATRRAIEGGTMAKLARPAVDPTLIEIRRESWRYTTTKPGKVPPADSRNRPNLARLWQAAARAARQRRNARTFAYAGTRFALVYMGESLCVMELRRRAILVKPPTSQRALAELLGDAPC